MLCQFENRVKFPDFDRLAPEPTLYYVGCPCCIHPVCIHPMLRQLSQYLKVHRQKLISMLTAGKDIPQQVKNVVFIIWSAGGFKRSRGNEVTEAYFQSIMTRSKMNETCRNKRSKIRVVINLKLIWKIFISIWFSLTQQSMASPSASANFTYSGRKSDKRRRIQRNKFLCHKLNSL